MILQCPACNSRYAVPDHAIGATGRIVRCVKCAHEWFVAGPQATVENLEELLKVPEPVVEKPIPKNSSVPKKMAPKSSPVLTGTMLACALVATIITFFVSKPQWFGFAPTAGVTFSDLKLQKQKTDVGMEYAVSGKLVNTTDKIVIPPKIRIILVDKEGAPLKQWEVEAPEQLAPQQAFPVSYGPLKSSFSTGDRLVVDLGNPLQIAMRSKP